MSEEQSKDAKLQSLIGATLRSGVVTATLIGLVGGAIFLASHGSEPVSFHSFKGAGTPYASPSEIVRQVFEPKRGNAHDYGLAVTQLGIMVLLLTPIIRVALSIVGFAQERDNIYVAITCVVLITLIGSLLLH